MIVMPQEGALALWQQILKIADIGYPIVHLFGAAHTPLHTDTYSTFAAIEVAGGIGYVPIQLVAPGANWTLTPIGAGAQASHAVLTWTFTGAATIYGYWVADGTNSVCLWAEAFSGYFSVGPSAPTFLLQLIPWLASYPDVGGIPCTSP